MNTKEILNLLKSKQVFSLTLPEWVYMSLPVPCMWGNEKALVFYFYPTRRQTDRTIIYSPMLRIVISYPNGILLDTHKAPFTKEDDASSKWTPIGNYPGSKLSQKSFDEVTDLYEQYYMACDDVLANKPIASWQKLYAILQEEGLKKYYELLPIIGQ